MKIQSAPISRETLVKTVSHNLNGDRLAILYETWSRLTFLGKPLEGECYDTIACEGAKAIIYAPLPHAKHEQGKEEEVSFFDFYQDLLKKLKSYKLKRLDMTTALHPHGTAIAVRYTATHSWKFLPFKKSARVPTLVVLETMVDADRKRKIEFYSEHYAETEQDALDILKDFYYWPEETTVFSNYSFSGE